MVRIWFIDNTGKVDTRVFGSHKGAKRFTTVNGIALWDTDQDRFYELLADVFLPASYDEVA